jgi:hypothetical protein
MGFAMATPQMTPQTLDADERRSATRFAVSLEARIFPGGRHCMIKDFSLNGARVQLGGDSGPDDLILVIWASGQAFEGQAVWWRGDEIGVRFIRTCQLSQPAPVVFREAQLAWQQHGGSPAAS